LEQAKLLEARGGIEPPDKGFAECGTDASTGEGDGKLKVIFLDIDGVLVNRRSLRRRSGQQSTGDGPRVNALNRIIETTHAELVLSSTWRLDYGREEMDEILARWGVRATLVGATVDMLARHSGR
jgi:hypothetical protein